MDIVAISDSHDNKPRLPDGDLLIHSGDLTMMGTRRQVKQSIQWLGDLARNKYKHGVVYVPGNHDFLFEDWREGLPKVKKGMEIERDFAQAKEWCDKYGVRLLMNESVEIEGVKIYGSPEQPWFHDWAFNIHRDVIGLHWAKIPDDVQILITHGPPFGIGDLCPGGHVGCQALLERIKDLKDLKMHIFGHIHEGAGHSWFQNKLFVNASVLDGRYNGYEDIQVIEWPELKVRSYPDEYV